MEKCIICNKKQIKQFTYHGFEYFKCPKCGLVSTFPYPTDEEIEKHYQKEFKKGNYRFLRNYSAQYRRVYRGFLREIKRHLNSDGRILSGIKILDIGCFTGDFLYMAAAEGAEVRGVELQKEAVEIADIKLPGRVVQKDIASNPFKNQEFDIITMFGLIEHVKDPASLISNVSKLLKKDGILVIQTPNSGSFLARTMKKYWPAYTPVEHIHLFTKKSVKLLLGKHQLKLVFFKNHFKILPVAYVYNMLDVFGPEIKKILKKFELVYNPNKSERSLPFYIGEMFIIAKKT